MPPEIHATAEGCDLRSRKSPGLAALLSVVIPGLGQTYVEGVWQMGLAFVILIFPLDVAFWITLAYSLPHPQPPEFWWFVAAYAAVAVLFAADAHRVARRWNRGIHTLRKADVSFLPDPTVTNPYPFRGKEGRR